MKNAHSPFDSIFSTRTCDFGGASGVPRAVQRVHHDRAAGTGRLFATDLPAGRLSLDAGLLGLWRRGLLLGTGHMDSATQRRLAVDPWILGMELRRLRLEWRVLGR